MGKIVTQYRIGVDIGGTFTDFVLFDDEGKSARTYKCLTTPDDPAQAVVEGVLTLTETAGLRPSDIGSVVHGTTLVTNAVIERKGVNAAMLVTRGFRDVLEIAQERRYDLFDLTIRFPKPVIPRALRFEVVGRLRYDGSEIETLALDGIGEFLEEAIRGHQIEAVAICLLHSYADPRHEAKVVAFVARQFPQLAISSSAEVFPFIREYARWTTTCINAYVQPVVDRYLERFEQGLRSVGFQGRIYIMSSSGGTLTPELARRFPVRLLESGPAAGALMSARHGRLIGSDHLLSFDMGGTTAKGCIVRDGAPLKRYELEVAREHEFKKGSGFPVKIPVLDMIEIGAGGGSLATIDERGVIRVGPKSAGADPGPACYGRGGTRPTLTDANLVLGFLGARSFLGGQMRIDQAAARQAIEREISAPLRISTEHAAWGIHEVISEDVARAFRVHASEQGVDYRRCTMIIFGGSGPVHGTRVARKLRIPRVVCPMGAGVMSAFGLLSSPLAFEIARSHRVSLRGLADADRLSMLEELSSGVEATLLRAGLRSEQIRTHYRLDMRYEGQGYEIEVPLAAGASGTEDLLSAFERIYRETFGLCFEGRAIEIVNWKAEGVGPAPSVGEAYHVVVNTRSPAGERERLAWDPETFGYVAYQVVNRYAMKPGDVLDGPALIEEHESTCVVGRGDRVAVDEHLNLIIEVGAS
jgi:N-methylhydantoinase A